MSVKELCARLSVLLVMCAFAVSAKALVAQPTYMDGGMGFIIQVEKNGDKVDELHGGAPADLKTAIYNDETINPNNCVQGIYKDRDSEQLFLRYQSPGGAPGDVWLSDITKAKIRTADGVTLDGPKLDQLKTHYPNLAYLDFENASVANNAWGNLNSMSQLRTLIFSKADGLKISKQAFQGNQYIETVIFPDNDGTYQIMEDAFKNSKVQTVSLGKGYSIPDFAVSGNQWKSGSGSGKGIFEHCTQLKNVVLDNSITNLGEKAFAATYSLEQLILPDELLHIGYLCFKESGVRTITIPDKLDTTGGSQSQIFQGCIQLLNIYVNTDNMKAPDSYFMENNQTTNFKWKGNDPPTYSVADYYCSSVWTGSDYNDSPFEGKAYSTPILHYPGTVNGISNYRIPKYMHYSLVDPETGTTWAASNEISSYNPITVDGVTYPGFSYNDQSSEYGGWKMFPLGNNTFKEQTVFYDERIKESRWYSICLPVNMTEAQFMNAYGVGAALHEFSGAVYDPDKKAVILQFNTPATADANGVLLKKNVPYMIHPAKVKLTKRKVVTTHTDGSGNVDGVEFVTTTGGDYATTEVIATYDVESDLFVRWDVMLNGGDPLAQALAEVETNTASALSDNAVTQVLDASQASAGQKPLPANFTFRGSYLGAQLYAPTTVKVGDSPNLPKGAFYLGKDGDKAPAFYKAKGNGVWSPYCALITSSSTVSSGSGAGAKEFDMLEFDFNNMSDYMVETGIGAPTIQIPVIKTDSKIYNLNGQVVRESSKDTNGLKGIFIVGGKKVIFK